MQKLSEAVCTGTNISDTYEITDSHLGRCAHACTTEARTAAAAASLVVLLLAAVCCLTAAAAAAAAAAAVAAAAAAGLTAMLPPVVRSGAFSDVFVVVLKETGEKRAVKRIAKKMMMTTVGNKRVIDLKPIEQEVHLQRECCAGAENIVKIFDVYDSGPIVDIVLEPMKKDDLFDAIETVYYPEDGSIVEAECRYSELAASRMVKQVISAVGACHAHGICHRDLKPENILVHTYISDQEPLVKLCDFGLAMKMPTEPPTAPPDAPPGWKVPDGWDVLHEACGTPEYVAPEVVTKGEGYGLAADIWSIGVMLFILLCGEQPFHSDQDGSAGTRDVIKQVKSHKSIASKFETAPIWNDVSSIAKELLEKHMLARDPSKRMTAAQLLEHPWVTGKAAPKTAMAKALLNNHKMWLRRKFRVAIFTLIATNRIRALIHGLKAEQLVQDGLGDMTIESHYGALLDSFVALVPEEHGMVTKDQFVSMLQKHSIATGNESTHFEAFKEDFGMDDESHVNYRDYTITLGWRCASNEDVKMKLIFKAFDLDHNGEIDHDEFVLLVNRLTTVGGNERKTPAQSSALFTKIDSNNDNRIDEGEFLAWASQVRNLAPLPDLTTVSDGTSTNCVCL